MFYLIKFEIIKILYNKKFFILTLFLFLLISTFAYSKNYEFNNKEDSVKKLHRLYEIQLNKLEYEKGILEKEKDSISTEYSLSLEENVSKLSKSVELRHSILNACKKNDFKLQNDLEKERISLIEKDEILDYDSDIISTEYINNLKKITQKNDYLMEKNIDPIDEYCEMNGMNFINQTITLIFPIFIPIFIFLSSGDSISKEFKKNEYKVLYTQPIKKEKIFIAKFIANFILNFISVFGSLIVVFIFCSIINGVGSFKYPIYYNQLNNVISSNSNTKILIPFSCYLFKYLLLFFFVMIFIQILSFLISSIFKSFSTSLLINIILFTSIYGIINNSTILKRMSLLLNPITYVNVGNVLNGYYYDVYGFSNITLPSGIIALILYIVSFVLITIKFSRKFSVEKFKSY